MTPFWKTPPILKPLKPLLSRICLPPVLLSLWVLALGTIAFLWHLGSVGLVDETEPLFAEAARQMIVRQDWVTPYFNEVQRFDKPPLIYWLMALCYQIFGINEWAVRLPSALSAIVLVAIVAYSLVTYGQPWGWGSAPDSSQNPGWRKAVWGAAMVAFCGEMLAWGRVGVSDMLLNACMGCSLLCFFHGYAQSDNKPGRGIWYFAAYTWAALAVLTKGPIGLVLPGLIILAFLIYIGQFWTVLREMQIFGGLFWIFVITIPWYVLVIQANGDAYIQSFFGYHNFERFTRVVNNHGAPWYFYFLVVLVGFAPWSIYLPPALYRLRFWQWQRWRSSPRQAHLGIFAFFWFIGVFGFFTIAVTKLPSYVLPLMPAAAILVALYGQEEWTENTVSAGKHLDHHSPKRSLFWRIFPWINVGFLVILTLGFLLGTIWLQWIKDPAMPNLPKDLDESGLLWRGGIILLITTIATIFFIPRKPIQWIWGSNLVGFVLLFCLTLIPAGAVIDTHRQQPLRELSSILATERRPGEALIMLAFEKPSIVFYSQGSVRFFRDYTNALAFIYEQSSTLSPPDTLLILTYPRRFAGLGLVPGSFERLGQRGSYELGRVEKSRFRDRPLDLNES